MSTGAPIRECQACDCACHHADPFHGCGWIAEGARVECDACACFACSLFTRVRYFLSDLPLRRAS